MLCALDMRVHGTHLVYKAKYPCRGLHTLGMSLSEFECSGIIALQWCTKIHRITWVCVHGTDLALCLVLNYVGSGMGRSPIESHNVK